MIFRNSYDKFTFHKELITETRKHMMKISKLKILSILFSSISLVMFLSLRESQNQAPMIILSISGALVFFAIAVMNVIETVHKRHVGQLKGPFQVGSIAFALTGVTGAGRSAYLGILTGAWEYWALVMNLLLFVLGVLVLWYNRFIKKLLQDVRKR